MRGLSALLISSCLWGCVGTMESGPPAPGSGAQTDASKPGSGTQGTGAGPGGLPGAADRDCQDALIAPRAVLMTPRQYQNVLRDLLGPTAVSDADLAADAKLEFELVDLPRMTTDALDRVLRLSERAVESLRGHSATWLGCSVLTDKACVRQKLGALARRAFKRPATADELDAVMGVYEVGNTDATDAGESAVLGALQAILSAPSTLYRTEFLSAESGPTRALTGYERASALALFLLDSVPDEELLAAAERGDLQQSAGVQKQITRLLALPAVRSHVTELVLSAFRIDKVFGTPKDPAAYPDYTPALQSSMVEESRRFVDDILWQGGSVDQLLASKKTFVDPALARLYGVPYPGKGTDFVQVQLPDERSGLLTQASVLSVLSRTDKTSVVARGLFVRSALLCLPDPPSPPASVQAQIAAQLAANATQRELAQVRATTSPCNGCHAQFDRFGLLLEDFDAIGKRTSQPSVALDLTGLGDFQGSLQKPVELAQQALDSGDFTQCFTQRVLRYALTANALADGSDCAVSALSKSLRAGDASFQSLITGLAQSDMFALRSHQEP